MKRSLISDSDPSTSRDPTALRSGRGAQYFTPVSDSSATSASISSFSFQKSSAPNSPAAPPPPPQGHSHHDCFRLTLGPVRAFHKRHMKPSGWELSLQANRRAREPFFALRTTSSHAHFAAACKSTSVGDIKPQATVSLPVQPSTSTPHNNKKQERMGGKKQPSKQASKPTKTSQKTIKQASTTSKKCLQELQHHLQLVPCAIVQLITIGFVPALEIVVPDFAQHGSSRTGKVSAASLETKHKAPEWICRTYGRNIHCTCTSTSANKPRCMHGLVFIQSMLVATYLHSTCIHDMSDHV